MKAVVLTDYGDVDKLELRDLPDLKPGPGEVKIRTVATSVTNITRNSIAGFATRTLAKSFISLEIPAVLRTAPKRGLTLWPLRSR